MKTPTTPLITPLPDVHAETGLRIEDIGVDVTSPDGYMSVIYVDDFVFVRITA